MHTRVREEGVEYRIHHNGDWSGMVIIQWNDAKGAHEVELPAALFLRAGRIAGLQEAVEAIEDRL